MASKDPLADKVSGYPKLACSIELRPETAIFRRFGALNAENILYYQAELSMLETDLRKQQKRDSVSGHARKSKYALNWYELGTSPKNGEGQQLDLVLRIRETLKVYNEALIQYFQILGYQEPDRCDLKYLQNFLHHEGLPLTGLDANVWGTCTGRKNHSPDLVTLHPRQKEDPFSSLIVDKAISALFCCGCDRYKRPSDKHGVVGFEDSNVMKFTQWITNILASLIPIASIIVLYCVHSMPARLGIIAGFNLLISVCLSIFTNAKRAEVFAITAAFAAVQVVFVNADKK